MEPSSDHSTSSGSTGRAGLVWPQQYRGLRDVIRQQWEIEGEIYLLRSLSGLSGARVFATDMHSKEFTGQAILKLDRAPDPQWQKESEAQRHARAFAAAPQYAREHLPQLLHALHHGDQVAILSTIVGRGLEYVRPWAECAHPVQLQIAREVSADLLELWNANYQLVEGLREPQELLEVWLEYRLSRDEGRLHEFFGNQCGIPAEQPSFLFEGYWYPNPLAFALRTIELPPTTRMRAVVGNQHGDLHGFNVLVPARASTGPDYHLIDLAFYSDKQFLFFDHAYFELSHLLRSRRSVETSQLEAILYHLSEHHQCAEHQLHSDDLGLLQVLGAVREQIDLWVDRHQPSRLSYLSSQILLARVAAGLRFANMTLSTLSRCIALLYASSSLKDYLLLHGIEWPKHGPPLGLEGKLEGGVTAGATPSPVVQKSANGATTTSAAAQPSQPAPPPLPDKPSIAVLPLQNLGGDPEQEYFADAISHEIITQLGQADWLTVISRSSTFAYRGKSVAPQQVGRELGVHYVVQGTVHRSGQRVRLYIELSDARGGSQLWSHRYDLDVDGIFAMQDEIVQSIAANIDVRLESSEQELARRKPPADLNAWDLFQKALWHFFRYTHEDDQVAEQLTREAIARAPEFAPPHALLSYLYTRQLLTGTVEQPRPTLEAAMEHATRSVALDDRNSLGRMALGRASMLVGREDMAIVEYRAAIELNPNSSTALFGLALALAWSGRAEEALEYLDKSIRLSPRGMLQSYQLMFKSLMHFLLDQPADAEKFARGAIGTRPSAPFDYVALAMTLAQQGRVDQARSATAEALRIRPELSLRWLSGLGTNAYPPFVSKVLAACRKAGVPEE